MKSNMIKHHNPSYMETQPRVPIMSPGPKKPKQRNYTVDVQKWITVVNHWSVNNDRRDYYCSNNIKPYNSYNSEDTNLVENK